jgi:hypothetical protein
VVWTAVGVAMAVMAAMAAVVAIKVIVGLTADHLDICWRVSALELVSRRK